MFAGMGSQHGETVKEPPGEVVTAQEFGALVGELSNWNRWGPEDQRGALHFLTPERIAAAATLVREGVGVSLSLPWNTHLGGGQPDAGRPSHDAVGQRPASHQHVQFLKDFVGIDYHGDGHTHIDALCHVAYEAFSTTGVRRAAVTPAGDSVECDRADQRRVDRPGGPAGPSAPARRLLARARRARVRADHLEAAERDPGRDATARATSSLVRTGHAGTTRRAWPVGHPGAKAGLHPMAMPFLADRRVAALGLATGTATPRRAPPRASGSRSTCSRDPRAGSAPARLSAVRGPARTCARAPAVGVPVRGGATVDPRWHGLAGEPAGRAVMPGEYRIEMAARQAGCGRGR